MAKKQISSAAQTTVQAGKFGLVGIMNTAIDYILFIGLTKVFSIPLDRVWIAKLISGTAAIINSFYWNRTWVFKSKSKADLQQQAFKFLVTTGIGVYIIQTGLVQLFSNQFQGVGIFFYDIANTLGIVGLVPSILTEAFVIKTVAFGLGTLASMTWNFLLYKFWAFKE